MQRIWGLAADAEINVVWVYISYLRKKLSTPGILGAVIILLCVAAETMMKDDKPLS